MADAGGDETSLEFTPTWVVALVCFSILFISIAVDRSIRGAGKLLKENHETWPLIVASRKIRDELMLLGLISLLLAAFQTRIGKICISERLANTWLPCNKPYSSSTVANLTTSSFTSTGTQGRRLLAMASDTADYCSQKGKVPLLSVEAVHHLDIFLFVLAVFHVVLCLLKILYMIIQWKCLEIYDEMLKDSSDRQHLVLRKMRLSIENQPGFFLSVKLGMLKGITLVSLSQYIVLRVSFREACPGLRVTSNSQSEDKALHLVVEREGQSKDNALHLIANPDKEFQKYIIRTLQEEFEEMVRIRWYLWLFVVIYLLVNVAGWHAYFWISFIPLILWLIIHFKLEGMLRRRVKALAKKLTTNEEESSQDGAKESDFTFRLGLFGNLIHFVLFENSLQLAFFFFILFQYGFHSCIMGKVGFVVPRIAIGLLLQVMCMCRTLPLLAIMKSQMNLKKPPDEHKIRTHLKEHLSGRNKENLSDKNKANLLDRHIEKCLDDLGEIKISLKDIVKDEKEEMSIMTWISDLIDERKNQGKERSSTEAATDIEQTQTGPREGSVSHQITEDRNPNPIEDIEAQKSPTNPNK